MFLLARTVAKDDAVHAFYKITRAELAGAVRQLIALRIARGANLFGPLEPHHCLFNTDDGVDATMAQRIGGIVLDLAGAANLIRITEFTPSALGRAWNFSGFDVTQPAGSVARMEIPHVAAGTQLVSLFAGFEEAQLTGEPAFVPVTLGHDNMQLLGNRALASRASHDDQQRALDALVRIENPEVHSPKGHQQKATTAVTLTVSAFHSATR